jgi:RimJ/RimL family protein N-acetyltransferase
MGDGCILRKRRAGADAVAYFAELEASREHLEQWIPWAVPKTLEAARDYLAFGEAAWDTGDAYHYFVVLPDGQIAGAIGLFNRVGRGASEVGYWIGQRFCRRGLARRASWLLTRAAFECLGAERVEVHHEKALEASSGGVPRTLGFARADERPNTREPLPGETGILVRWVLTREQYAAREAELQARALKEAPAVAGAAGTEPGAPATMAATA